MGERNASDAAPVATEPVPKAMPFLKLIEIGERMGMRGVALERWLVRQRLNERKKEGS